MYKSRSSEYRRFKVLSNGQVAMFYAKRTFNHRQSTTWELAIVISYSKKHCRMSHRDAVCRPKRGKFICDLTTGKAGLEGMRAMKAMLTEFMEWLKRHPGSKEHLVAAHPWDDKRRKAYRYLERLGFYYFTPPEGEDPYYYTYVYSHG